VSDEAGRTAKVGPNWGVILGLLVGVVVALAIFIPAIMTRPTPKPTVQLASTPVSTNVGTLPGPLGGSSVLMDVDTLVGRPAPAFTLSDSEGVSFPISPGGGIRTVLIFNMGVT
jgi:hypothetical protein